ncbi:uncharacterized protein LOC115254647 [Aedes albopictus]|uniref:DDE-1 domain-containing protein n=1 Tax=Aedes albopictus TaxID=7160 RepID=A0ABM1ZI13_AEDAL
MRRHPQLSFRTPEAVSSASAKVTEQDIRKWFRTVKDYLIENNLMDVLEDPSRILNGDETGFRMDSSPKKVLATKGAKNVPFVETQNSKQNVTVLFSFAADGTIIPPDVILPLKRMSCEIAQSFPHDWGLGTSESGWMNSYNFTVYIKRVLHPTLIKRNVKFPVLYFVDGHKSHTALEAADACAELGIILIALFPNATRIIQPADVSIFRPLKNSWERVVEIWRTDEKAEKLTIPTIGPLLEKTMESAFKKSTIINAFRVCGLYPFDPDAVDYSKCIASSHCRIKPASQISTNITLPMDTSKHEKRITLVPTSAIESALQMIGSEKIELYRFGDPDSFSNEDKMLSFIYNNILSVGRSDYEQSYEEPTSMDLELEAAIAEPIIILEDEEGNLANYENGSLNLESRWPSMTEKPSSFDEHLTHQNISETVTCPGFLDITHNKHKATPASTILIGHDSVLEEEHRSNCSEVDTTKDGAPIVYQESGEDTLEFDHEEITINHEDEFEWYPDSRLNVGQVESPIAMEKFLCDDPPSDFANSSSLYNHLETQSSSASNFFVAPPSPKRSSKHRFYKQKSYAILTAGERLQELRQIEINKEVAAKEKIEKAEKRKTEKLKKEVAALIRAEEKENARKMRDFKKEEAAAKRAEKKENAKKMREEKKEKKKNAGKRFDKLLV